MITWKDVFRPISSLIILQPFILIWLIFTSDDPIGDYGMVGWGLQIYVSCILIPYYAIYEKLWAKQE